MKNPIFLKAALVYFTTLGISALPEAGWISPSYAATFEPAPFETLSVNSETPLTAVFSSVLSNGVRYKVEASGQFTPDFRATDWDVDARFVSRNNFTTVNDLDPSFFNFDFGLFSAALGGNNDDFWGNYQSTNIYSYEFSGAGSSIDFYVNDVSLASGGDNRGIFSVGIFREQASTDIPEPSILLGLLTISGVGLTKLNERRRK